MKKRFILLVLLPAFVIFASKVSAASKCEATELVKINEEAAGVKVTYEEVKELVDSSGDEPSDFDVDYEIYKKYFKVNIINVTDNLYIKITDTNKGTTRTFTSNDAVNGVISFKWEDLSAVGNLKTEVFTSQATKCPNENITTTHVVIPMKNVYYEYKACAKNPDAAICKEYVTEKVTPEAYQKLADKEERKTLEEVSKDIEEENKSSITKFIKKNKKGIIIGGSIIIVLGVVTTAVVIIKRKRSRII